MANDPEFYAKQKAYQKEHYRKRIEENPNYIKEVKNHRDFPRGRTHQLLYHAKKRAEKKGWEFSVGFDQVHDAIVAGKCAVTGLSFDLKSSKSGHFNAFAPSIDRIDSTKPYTSENVQIVIWAYNVGKSQMTDRDYHAYILAVADHLLTGVD